MRTRYARALGVILAAAAILAGAADVVRAPAGGAAAARAQMLALINAERARAGVAPLRLDAALTAIAQARSQDMLTRHYFSHRIPGRAGVHSVFDLLAAAHVRYERAGEAIARTTCPAPLRQAVQRINAALMRSPPHRALILAPQYRELGLGLACARASGTLVLTAVFVQP